VSGVFCSLLPDPGGVRERPWIRSLESLRRHNTQIEVILVPDGAARTETPQAARRAGAGIAQTDPYPAAPHNCRHRDGTQ